MVAVEIACLAIKAVYFKERPDPLPRGRVLDKLYANSFPSIHSARIAALATLAVSYFGDIPTILLSVIVVGAVGWSRIYLKRHDMMDVVGGFAIGIALAAIIFHIV
jgi:membrane-associated phospholipid phosphatase